MKLTLLVIDIVSFYRTLKTAWTKVAAEIENEAEIHKYVTFLISICLCNHFYMCNFMKFWSLQAPVMYICVYIYIYILIETALILANRLDI